MSDLNNDLLNAAQNGDVEKIKQLIARGADNNNNNGFTALHVAVRFGHVKAVEALIAAGTYVNVTDDNGRTALHVAALFGHAEIVKALIDAKAEVNAKDNDGHMALYWSTIMEHATIAVFLLNNGADRDIAGVSGKKEEDYVIKQKEYMNNVFQEKFERWSKKS